MPSAAYDPVLSGPAVTTLLNAKRVKQRTLVQLIDKLSEFPGQLGDYTSVDDAGRVVQHVLIGDWLLSFWADHATRELRVTDIVEV